MSPGEVLSCFKVKTRNNFGVGNSMKISDSDGNINEREIIYLIKDNSEHKKG